MSFLHLYRPFWHPNSQPFFRHPDVQRLTQELDAARHKIARYETRILSLNAELKAYRGIIRCIFREKVLHFAGRLNYRPHYCNPATVTTPPSATSVKAITPGNHPQSNQSDWSVLYNPHEKRLIDVNVAHTFKYPTSVLCLKFSSDGKYIAIGLQRNGRTHIYDLTTGKEKCVLADFDTKDQVCIWAVDFSPDNRYIATGSNNQICIWEIEQRRMLATFKKHSGDVFSLFFSPDGRFLVSGSYDDSVRTWRLRDGSSWELLDNALGYFAVCFSPDGQFIAAANSDKILRIWRTRTGKLVDKWSAHTESVRTVAFTSDGKGLVSGGNDQTIKYWGVGSIGVSSREESPRPKSEIFKLQRHTDSVRSVAFLPNEQLLLSGSNDRTVRIWNVSTAAWQCTLHVHKHRITAVDSSHAGDYLASGSLDGEVKLCKYV